MGDNKAQRGFKIAGVSIVLLLVVFVITQWTLGLDKLILWEYVSWSYEGSHFDFEMAGMMADSFWSRHISLEGFSFRQPQSHYEVSHTAVTRSDSPEGERVQILAQVMYTAEHSDDEGPAEAVDLVLTYRLMGLRRTLSQPIPNFPDIKRVAYDLLHASEKQMITDWRLAAIDEVKVNQWSEETTFRVVFPTKSDAVFEHLA